MELFEYDFKDDTYDYKEWMEKEHKYMIQGRTALSHYISDIEGEIIDVMDKHYTEPQVCCRARVFEHGIILGFHDWDENYNWGDYEPVDSYAIIYDTGEIHYVITTFGLHSYTGNYGLYSQLTEKLGNEVEYVGKDEIKLSDKKRDQLNLEIRRIKEAKVRTVLGNIKEQLEAEKEDFPEEDRRIIEMADYLNKEAGIILRETEDMKRILRTQFQTQDEDEMERAITKHLSYTGKIFTENKLISETQEQIEKKKRKKKAA